MFFWTLRIVLQIDFENNWSNKEMTINE